METQPTPVEEFIADRITPREGMRYWPRDGVAPAGDLLERAAKARGLTLRRVGKHHLLFYAGARLVGSFDGRETNLVSAQASKAAGSSRLQQGYLRAAGVPTASEAGESAPAGAGAARGPLDRVDRATLALRCYVLGEAVVAAVVRVPRHVVGTGEDAIAGLIAAEEGNWRKSAYLADLPRRRVRDHLAQQGLDEDSVPEDGRVVFLEELRGEPGRAITVDVLEELGEELSSLAVDAMWAFPGLDGAVVDIRTPRLDSAGGAAVVDVDPIGDIVEFRFPTYGADRRVAVDIIDRMKR